MLTVIKEKLHLSFPQPFSSDICAYKQDLMNLKDEWIGNITRIGALLTRGTPQPANSPVHIHVPHSPQLGHNLGHHLFHLMSLAILYWLIW